MRQLSLDLQFMSAQGRDDFIVGACNRLAAEWIDRWPDWPGQFPALNIVGPPASGKSHLGAVWQQASDARHLTNLQMADLQADLQGNDGIAPDKSGETDKITGHMILDQPAPNHGPGQDAWSQEALFHLFNRAAGQHSSILILTSEPVSQMDWHLPDLASRLRAVNVVRLEAPDDAVLRGVLEKYFTDRQLAINAPVLDFMVSRMERSFAAVQIVAGAMDQRSLAQKRDLTMPLAREIMADFGADFGADSRLDFGPDFGEK
ncbi:DnaA/Hda family protein [Alphaproteobacteria bacterium]|jgi:chromosomal replication initiation ATPase DnaA|nr:DnaA/Hda family protein [Alphaproteobacteria bacterium]